MKPVPNEVIPEMVAWLETHCQRPGATFGDHLDLLGFAVTALREGNAVIVYERSFGPPEIRLTKRPLSRKVWT